MAGRGPGRRVNTCRAPTRTPPPTYKVWDRGGKTNFFTLEVQNWRLPQVYIGHPSETYLLADSLWMDIQPGHVVNIPIFGFIYRHYSGEMMKMAFFDGHAKTWPRSDQPIDDYYSNPAYDNYMAVVPPW